LKKAGIRYAELLGKHNEKVAEAMITRFFGVFFMISQLSGIVGNLLMSIGDQNEFFFKHDYLNINNFFEF